MVLQTYRPSGETDRSTSTSVPFDALGLPGHQPSRARPRALRKSITNHPRGRSVDDHLGERGRVLGVVLEVAEAGEQIDREVHRRRSHRQGPHVRSNQRRGGHVPRDPEERRRQVEAEAARAGRLERRGRGAPPRRRRRAPASPARSRPRSRMSADRPVRLGVVAMRVELEILLTEPFLEPFGHSRVTGALVIRLAPENRDWPGRAAPPPRRGPARAAASAGRGSSGRRAAREKLGRRARASRRSRAPPAGPPRIQRPSRRASSSLLQAAPSRASATSRPPAGTPRQQPVGLFRAAARRPWARGSPPAPRPRGP